MRLGVAAALRLSRWAWLHAGKDRRLVGWDEDGGLWTTTAAIVAVGTSALGKPPIWATAADHREIRLSTPAADLSDEMLGALDELRRSHPFFQIQGNAALSVRLWHPKPALSDQSVRRSA